MFCELKNYKCCETFNLDNDGYIGIPVEITTYFDKENFKAISGYESTNVIIYVVGTRSERIGTLSDLEIVSSMLKRGYIVCILDYLNNEKAISPKLEWSAQKIKQDVMAGKFFADKDIFVEGKYYNAFIVPEGYDVSINNVYCSLDKHSNDGSLEKIVEIWNNDFRSTKRDIVIKWTDENGNRKSTQTGWDDSEPVWLDKNGNPDNNGEYIKINHTLANTILDCVKRDGTPIDMDIYMHIIYPTAPNEKVPVMCLASSSEHLVDSNSSPDRPQLTGFSFNGYAVAMYDYAYTPMARDDHYSYFDGDWCEGHITGDNGTYSIHYYNDKLINRAAIRYLKYLAFTNDLFKFDTEHFGVFGNSKAGFMHFLGEKEVNNLYSKRMFLEKYDKTRFENGKTEPFGFIRGAEEQPWLKFNDTEISPQVQFTYTCCGGTSEYITKGHAPVFISCNTTDSRFKTAYFSSLIINACRTADVPTLWFGIDKGHTFAYGEDMLFGVDTYNAFFDFVNYYLKNTPIKVVYTAFTDDGLTIKFAGDACREEVEKIVITSANGELINGSWSDYYGKTEWCFDSDAFINGSEYTVIVPADFKGDNGKAMNVQYKKVLIAKEIKKITPKVLETPLSREIPFESFRNGKFTQMVIAPAPDGTKSLKLSKVYPEDSFYSQLFLLNNIVFFENDKIITDRPLTTKDVGRKFRVKLEVYDTISRHIQIKLNTFTTPGNLIIDSKQSFYNHITVANKWQEYEFDYIVYEPLFEDVKDHVKTLVVSGVYDGENPSPIYFKNFTVTEY